MSEAVGEASYHAGVLYGIPHPGASQVSCSYCHATLDQKAMIDKWLALDARPRSAS